MSHFGRQRRIGRVPWRIVRSDAVVECRLVREVRRDKTFPARWPLSGVECVMFFADLSAWPGSQIQMSAGVPGQIYMVLSRFEHQVVPEAAHVGGFD